MAHSKDPRGALARCLSYCAQPLPDGRSNNSLITELCQRVGLVLFYFVNDKFSTQDGSLRLVRSEGVDNGGFVILENGKHITKFVRCPPGSEQNWFQPGKNEQILKMLRIVMCRFMAHRKGLHLYHPAYPEPEMLNIEEVEGQSYPRRFVRQEWLNWLDDCNNKSHLTINVAMRTAAVKLYPKGHEGKTFKTKGITPEKGLEFEILETRNI